MTTSYFRPETNPGYEVPEEMLAVWDVQLALADKLMEVCRKHGLQIWMEGGTLLGAVRHEGFIPWDDDIDFAMMRDDYDRLCQLAAGEFEAPYFWQTTYNEKDFLCGHAILRDKRTTCVKREDCGRRFCQGIGIDIFVMDGVPSTAVGYALHRLTAKFLKFIVRTQMEKRYALISHKVFFRWMEGLFRLNNVRRKKRVGLISWRYRHKEIHLREYYEQTAMLNFAGRQWPAPARYLNYLSEYYGPDYMTPQNVANFHGRKYLDAHNPWEESVARISQNPAIYEERLSRLYL